MTPQDEGHTSLTGNWLLNWCVCVCVHACVCVCVCDFSSSSSPKSNSPHHGVQRSETSIKQMLLDWCRSKVKGYQVSWPSLIILDVHDDYIRQHTLIFPPV